MDTAQDLIRQFESCKLTAYQDGGGRWTIGWGRARGVKEGDICTQLQADAWRDEDLSQCEKMIKEWTGTVELLDTQMQALISFLYNVGPGESGEKDGLRYLKSGYPSTMLREILNGDFAAAAKEFQKWDHVDGIPCPGLLRRRLAEQTLFMKSDLG